MAKTKKKTAKKVLKATVKKAVKAVAKLATTKKAAKKAAPKAPAKTAPKASLKAAKKSSDVSYKLREGDRVPQFSGASTSGASINEGAHKTLILYFYPRDNTPGCTLEGQDFRRLYKQFQQAGAEIVGVSQDTIASHSKFKSKCDFPFELISDESGSVCKAFDVIQMKSMYGREFEGIERSTFLIKNGVVKKEWRKVKVDGHAQAVLDALKSV
jgi:peroxiredoxin Q/BCP